MTGLSGTYNKDGRKPVNEIYRAQHILKNDYGFILEEIFKQKIEKEGAGFLPVNCLRTEHKGPSLWIISGIHGEEPAGPVAIAENMNFIANLSKEIPLVMLPLCNPSGYVKNWRYHNTPLYSSSVPGLSVGDSEHFLTDGTGNPRRKEPSSVECGFLTKKVVDLSQDYPPVITLDFHEDDMIKSGYVYSSGPLREKDPVAGEIVNLFKKYDFPLCLSDKTRFGEDIKNGIAYYTTGDGSIEELLGAKEIFFEGSLKAGPSAKSVIVIETGAKGIPLKKRTEFYGHVIEEMGRLWKIVSGER